MYLQRKIHSLLKDHLTKRQISVVTGMRRTGKTTLVKQILSEIDSENKIYLDLERIDNRELFSEKNYDSIVYVLKQRGLDFNKRVYIVLDEIQLVKNTPSVLKYLYDNYNIKFIITGSSSYYIKNLFTESLAGRKKVFELFPLDFGEFLTFKNIHYIEEDFLHTHFNPAEYERLKKYYEEFLEYGGFPEVVLTEKIEEKGDLLTDIVSSYVNIDIKTLADFRDQKHIYDLMKMLAARICTKIDYSKLSRLIGISRNTVQNYVDFFEKTYLIKKISVFTKNPDREIVKAQKVYFNDNGLVRIMAQVHSGAMFENAIFTQLRHKAHLQYYSLKTGREIDFVLEGKVGLEIKESPTETDVRDLSVLSKVAGIKKYFLVGRHNVPRFNKYIWGGDIK